MSEDLKSQIERAYSKNPNYEGKHYSGNHKNFEGKKKSSKVQRQLDDLSSKNRSDVFFVEKNIMENFNKITQIESADNPDKVKKEDLRKGNNGNLGIKGIIGLNTYETYLKRAKTFARFCIRNYGIKRLDDIKPHMVGDFIQHQIDKGNSAKTIGSYLNGIKKLAEADMAAGIKSHKQLVNKHHEKMKPRYEKENRVRGRREDGSGMTLRDARILRKQASKISPVHEVAIDVLTEIGPRISEFMKLKWEHFDFENKQVEMIEKNMNKNNRPRVVFQMSDKTMDKLKAIYDSGVIQNRNQRIFGSMFKNEKQLYNFLKECSSNGKIAYLGVHAFRSSSVEYHQKQLEKTEKKLGKQAMKEKLAKDIMRHVSADPKLNPIVPKYRVKNEHAADKDGNLMFKKNGEPIKKVVYRKGGKPEWEPVMKDGKHVEGPKYSEEELLKRKLIYLKNVYISEILGHNRPDATTPYKG